MLPRVLPCFFALLSASNAEGDGFDFDPRGRNREITTVFGNRLENLKSLESDKKYQITSVFF